MEFFMNEIDRKVYLFLRVQRLIFIFYRMKMQ